MSLVGMRLDFKSNIAPSYSLAGAFPLPLDIGYLLMVGSNVLLSMVVQQ